MKASPHTHIFAVERLFWVLYDKYNSFGGVKGYINIIFFVFCFFAQAGYGQITDSTLAILPDTLTQNLDSVVVVDTVKLPYQISGDSLDAPVFFDARDSMDYDLKNKKIYLYGGAKIKYTTISLEAGYIELDMETNILSATYILDSVGNPVEKPEFADGSQNFTSNKLRYNFKTKKGQIIDARTFESNLYVLSEKAKFFAQDSTTMRDYVFSKNATFTTCDAEHPHYGIISKKQKVVPGKLIVVGPSKLEIMGVPTPLVLPFGFFPIFEKRHAGLIFPQDYESSPELGFGLRGIGYYFPLGPNYDLKVTGDIFMKGSWGVQVHSRYKKRYKYSGELSISMTTYKTEVQGELEPRIDRPKKIIWRHSQDSHAHPYNSFSASVNIESNKFERTTQNQAQNVYNNNYSSRVTFQRRFPSTPFSMTASLGHSQNVSTGKVTLELPTIDLRMRQIYPFKRKKAIGKERWYEKFSLTYSGQTKNTIYTSDSTMFDKETWQDLNVGFKHSLSSSASYPILKYLNFSPSFSYQELWYLKGEEYRFDPTYIIRNDTTFNDDNSVLDIRQDTTGYGSVDTTTLSGFKAIRSFNMSANLSTKIFGTLLFRRGFLRGFRHTMSPRVGFTFRPDFTKKPFGYYQTLQTDTRQAPDEYSTVYQYRNGIYGGPPSSGKQMSITYGIGHLFEAKYFSRKDSTTKNTRIFDNISMGGSYNFAADSLRFSKVSISGRSKLIKNVSNVTLSAIFDPYAVNDEGKTVNQFYWNTNHKILRFVKFDMSFSTGFTLEQLRKQFFAKEESKNKKNAIVSDRLFDWFKAFRISHNLRLNFQKEDGRLKGKVSVHTINTNGQVALTPLWKLRVGNIGYDFNAKRMTYPDFGFSRNIHCWDMGVNWQPQRGTYSFFLKVTAPPLDFLKLPYNRNIYDAQRVAF